MTEYINIDTVFFKEPLDLGTKYVQLFYTGDTEVYFIQGRTYGVRIIFNEEGRKALTVPWHNVEYVVEEE